MLEKSPYQLVALTKLRTNGLNCVLVADGVGVGKTISSALAIVALERPNEYTVIVCPPTLVDKWIGELRFKLRRKARPIRSRQDLETAESEAAHVRQPTIYVLASSLLQSRQRAPDLAPRILVIDEIHNFRNKDTISHRQLLRLSAAASYRIGLSATPINNKVSDISSIFHIFFPQMERDALAMAIEDVWFSRRRSLLDCCITRFEKEKLGFHFAARRITNHHITPDPSYVAEVRTSIDRHCAGKTTLERLQLFRLAASSPVAISGALGIPIQCSSDPKLARLKELVTTSPHALIFCEFRRTMRYIADNVGGDTLTISGDTPLDERAAIIEEFLLQQDFPLVMTSVGAEGLDLQQCSTLVNYDLHWNPMVLEQRIGRIDRRGQKKADIRIHNFILSGSIDELILSRIQDKLQTLTGSVFDPRPIVSYNADGRFYDADVERHESIEAAALEEALAWQNKSNQSDYDLAEAINPLYCDPERLARIAGDELPWVVGGVPQNEIVVTLQDKARRFSEWLGEYGLT